MFWLIFLSPLLILIPISIYLDKMKGTGDPGEYKVEGDVAKRDNYFISNGGDGPNS